MRVRSARTDRRRHVVVRRALSALVVLLVGGAVAIAVPSTAGATTQTTTAAGYPGTSVQVQVRNDQVGPANTPWTFTAPPGTTITAAAGNEGGGLGQFSCVPTGGGAGATCGPSASGGWGVGNTVTVTLAIGAGALPGRTTGTTSIPGGESGTYGLTVLPNAVPDLLGCAAAGGALTDAVATPVFGKAQVGVYTPIANGTVFTTDTRASGFPAVSGVFSGVTGGPQYSSFGVGDFGGTTVFRGELGTGYQGVAVGNDSTLTIGLPFAQRLQFRLGGVDDPSVVDVSGTGPGGAVIPTAVVASTAPGSLTASTTGTAARIVGGSANSAQDSIAERAVDLGFTEPVTSITIRSFANGAGSDAGFVVTPPVGCQQGSVTATSGTPTISGVDAAAGTTTYSVPLSATIGNTSGADDMQLVPTVRTDLAAQARALGGTLDAIAQTSASAPACTVAADAVSSGHLVAAAPTTTPLAPGTACTLDATATVTLPQSQSVRTLTTTSTLASSPDDTVSRVKATATTAITFPGASVGIAIAQSGPTTAAPGETVDHTVVVTNTGTGAARDVRTSTTLPAGLTVASLPGACTQSGSVVACTIGVLGPGASSTLAFRLTIDAGLPDGATVPFLIGVATSDLPGLATDRASIRVVVPETSPGAGGGAAGGGGAGGAGGAGGGGAGGPGGGTGGGGGGGNGGGSSGGGSGTGGAGANGPRPTAPRPSGPGQPTPSPAPAPSASGAPGTGTGNGTGDGDDTGGAGGTGTGNGSGGPIGMDLRFAQTAMAPGTVAAMRGTLGPNASGRTVSIEFAGRVTPGMVYRTVLVSVGADAVDCQVGTTTFSCTIPLRSGQSADVEVRLFADARNAPDIARQQLAVTASRAAQSNAMTSTIAVGTGSSDTEQFASSITTFNVTTFPGAFIPLLSMLLLALAATVVETGRRRRAAAAGAAPRPGSAPGAEGPRVDGPGGDGPGGDRPGGNGPAAAGPRTPPPDASPTQNPPTDPSGSTS